MTLGTHCVKSWSTTQAVVALSSAEAELYALLKATSQTLGLVSLASDFGLKLSAKVHTDASAALSIVNRQGLGKLRHISVQYLWIQDRVRSGDVRVAKIPGVENPADLFTKHLPADQMEYHMASLGMATETDRAATAPALMTARTSAPDTWLEDGRNCMRIHTRPRRTLFTPLRVAGAPPGRALTPVRTTQGVYLDTGEEFVRTDSWTARSTAHMALCRPWVGTTTFIRRGEWASQ